MKTKISSIPYLYLLVAFFLLINISQKSFGQNIFKDTITTKKGKVKIMHIGWEDGRVAEFGTAYTLHRHEFRLNLLGRSSYAIGNKVEMSIYIPFILSPNIAFKYKFIDTHFFASAFEAGTATGAFPIVAVAGIILPGVALGGGTLGLLYGYDVHAKLYFSFHVSDKLTFSVRGNASAIYAGYAGGGAFAGISGNGAAVGLFPINVGKHFTYYSGGFETDFVINKKNVIVLNSGVGGFKGGNKELGLATLSWTHARKHFHYSFGLYSFFDPPTYKIFNDMKLPVSPYANAYWILNNGKTIKKNIHK